MRVLITGSTGLVGTALVDALRRQGHDAARLVRPATRSRPGASSPAAADAQLRWDPEAGELDPAADAFDAVVHLAGASIAEGRWTESRKRILRDSRVRATRHLVEPLSRLRQPPRVFVAASAIGFYGDRGEEELTEASPPGRGFLADLCREWEQESARAAMFGARVVMLRFGIILARHGGALPQMALPFRLGVGGRIGSGRQWMSWVALDDVVEIIIHSLGATSLAGPVNVVSPNPARNADFARALGRVMRRPALFPTPAFALRLALGCMADELLLASQRVRPVNLSQAGYRFRYPELAAALDHVWRGEGHPSWHS